MSQQETEFRGGKQGPARDAPEGPRRRRSSSDQERRRRTSEEGEEEGPSSRGEGEGEGSCGEEEGDVEMSELEDGGEDEDDDEEEDEEEEEDDLPYPGFIPLALGCLEQNTRPRSWCLRMITNPYPFAKRPSGGVGGGVNSGSTKSREECESKVPSTVRTHSLTGPGRFEKTGKGCILARGC
ncbi:hypothetical protein J437_LFUL010810 [Ladona fulva]|uniref:Voltage-dependent T-type calcium channel subunit alpha-1G n=1 Tax=Ladona fulva TaxID=123851 RepID=A0A8K0K9U3_LADFU|nr:hypothetical protein J437_LFUL010810 [Ladona fulva]